VVHHQGEQLGDARGHLVLGQASLGRNGRDLVLAESIDDLLAGNPRVRTITDPAGHNAAEALLLELLLQAADSARLVHQIAHFLVKGRVLRVLRFQAAQNCIEYAHGILRYFALAGVAVTVSATM
jgi:hypothetical protein